MAFLVIVNIGIYYPTSTITTTATASLVGDR